MITNREKLADFLAEKLYQEYDLEYDSDCIGSVLDMSGYIQSYLKEFEEHNQMSVLVIDRNHNVRS